MKKIAILLQKHKHKGFVKCLETLLIIHNMTLYQYNTLKQYDFYLKSSYDVLRQITLANQFCSNIFLSTPP